MSPCLYAIRNEQIERNSHKYRELSKQRACVKKINRMLVSELPGDDIGSLTCRTFVFQDEGHTLGNALKCIISRYPEVEFCGYTVPHPAETKMNFRIQTRSESAVEVLKRGLEDLEDLCDHTIALFQTELKDFNDKNSS